MTYSEQLKRLVEQDPHHNLRAKMSLLSKIYDKNEFEMNLHKEIVEIRELNRKKIAGEKVESKKAEYVKKKKSKYGF